MGHLSAVGASAQEALSRVLESYRRMSPGTSDAFDVHEPTLPPSGRIDRTLHPLHR